MVDVRKPASERGLVAICNVDVVEGENSREINARIHRRYMSEAALADPRAGGMIRNGRHHTESNPHKLL
jgi:hypothetical protein